MFVRKHLFIITRVILPFLYEASVFFYYSEWGAQTNVCKSHALLRCHTCTLKVLVTACHHLSHSLQYIVVVVINSLFFCRPHSSVMSKYSIWLAVFNWGKRLVPFVKKKKTLIKFVLVFYSLLFCLFIV